MKNIDIFRKYTCSKLSYFINWTSTTNCNVHFSDILFGLKYAWPRIYPGLAGQGLRCLMGWATGLKLWDAGQRVLSLNTVNDDAFRSRLQKIPGWWRMEWERIDDMEHEVDPVLWLIGCRFRRQILLIHPPRFFTLTQIISPPVVRLIPGLGPISYRKSRCFSREDFK